MGKTVAQTSPTLNQGFNQGEDSHHGVPSREFSPLLGQSAVLAPTNSGTLANPVNVAGELALRSLSMAKFDNRELSSNLPSTPTSSGLDCIWQTMEGEGGVFSFGGTVQYIEESNIYLCFVVCRLKTGLVT